MPPPVSGICRHRRLGIASESCMFRPYILKLLMPAAPTSHFYRPDLPGSKPPAPPTPVRLRIPITGIAATRQSLFRMPARSGPGLHTMRLSCTRTQPVTEIFPLALCTLEVTPCRQIQRSNSVQTTAFSGTVPEADDATATAEPKHACARHKPS